MIQSFPALFPDPGEVVTLEWESQPGGEKGWRLVSRDLGTGRELRMTLPERMPHDVPLAATIGLIALACNRSLRIWRHDNFTAPIQTVQNSTKQHFTAIAFHPSGRFLAATSNDATVKLYDTSTWSVAKTFTWNIGRMRSIAFSPDGTLAAAGSDTGKVVVWDVDL
jgi:WD40 repeat protein